MSAIVPYAIWAVLIIAGLALVALVLFGIRSLANGKVSPLSSAVVLTPLIIAVILGLVIGDWARAAIIASLIALVLATAALLVTGVRGLFT